jgi:hypothetical protein
VRLFVDGHAKSLEARFLGDLFGHIFQDEDKVLFGQGEVVAGFQGGGQAFVQNPRHVLGFPQGSNAPGDIGDVDSHGANLFALAAHGADPGPAGLDQPDPACPKRPCAPFYGGHNHPPRPPGRCWRTWHMSGRHPVRYDQSWQQAEFNASKRSGRSLVIADFPQMDGRS